ncbi:MAG: hypothetical protein CVV44_18390 [Spirochaetae bacterium HGW-Spirochaetae-1]|jgi:mannose-1-phosphate guanylyltransferase/phosphomannomutase|nr:MAG: hypothetical protein CVV44_18390 [Spirochaetae bacterium HGW-Spirochaetae-1]
MIRAVIMAGGEGTRLRPLTCNRAKPMIPVINKPVIEHALNLLKSHGIVDITISLFYLPDNIQNYFTDGSDWDVNISYSVEETPLGTAGGVKQAMGKHDDTLLVLSGDGIIDFDITAILAYHREKKSPFTIILNRVNTPTEYGIVITDSEGLIEKFQEKPSWSEVFSDTANTGMYVIEPDIINRYVPKDSKYDFSIDLFPLLRKKNIPLYGYIAEGYWCDVGNLTSYRDVHHDILDGLVKIQMPGTKISNRIWVGKDVEIDPESVIKGPVLLGDFVRVKKGAEIAEFSVIGNNCVIEESASIRRSVILHSTIIGPKSELRGALIGKRCVLQENVSVNEGAVVSDDCLLGNNVYIPAGTRVWPDKIIEDGTRLNTDLIWGQTEKKTLFSTEGIVGTFNIKITPEFSAKLGSALGAYLGKNAKIIVSKDTTTASHIIMQPFISGLLSMGVDVYDMEVESVPINRYSTRFVKADMGCYIQISPLTGLQFIQIRLFDKHGFEISPNTEKKIENIFYRGDFPRKEAFETGQVIYPAHHIESYIKNVKNYVDAAVLRKKRWKIILDCFHGTASHVFPDLLDDFGFETTLMRGQMKRFAGEEDTKTATRKAVNNIVRMAKINRDIGVMIGPHGINVSIIDELGNILTDDDVSLILSLYYLKYKDTETINVPVTTSRTIEKMIIANNGTVNRISSKTKAPQNVTDIFYGDEDGGRYPYLEQAYDPMITFLRVMKFLALEDKSLHEIKDSLPKSNLVNITIPCTSEEKAAVMRMLTADTDPSKIELIDGIKISEEDSWILVLPDATQPILHLYAEGDTMEKRDHLIDEYSVRIKKFKTSLS